MISPTDSCTQVTRSTLLSIPRLLNLADFYCLLVVQFSAFQEATAEGTDFQKDLMGFLLLLFIKSCSTPLLWATDSLGLRSFRFFSCCECSSTDMDGLMPFLEDLARVLPGMLHVIETATDQLFSSFCVLTDTAVWKGQLKASCIPEKG